MDESYRVGDRLSLERGKLVVRGPDEVDTRLRHQGGQAGDEVQRLEDDVGSECCRGTVF